LHSDDPGVPVEPGYVGTMISGIEMKIGENEEIVVRGPHIFPVMEPPGRNCACTARRMVPHWRSGEVNVRGIGASAARIKI